jgi:hypothetical protein
MIPRDDLEAQLRAESDALWVQGDWVRRATVIALAIQLITVVAGVILAFGSGMRLAPGQDISRVEDLGLLFAVVWPVGVILSAHLWTERRGFLYLHAAGAPVFLGIVLYSISVLSTQF